MDTQPIHTLLDTFASEVRRSDSDLRLDRAWLLFSAGFYPHLDIEVYLKRVEALATAVRERSAGLNEPEAIANSLRASLFEDAGFTGNAGDYYDPRNSFLNDVLDRRTGIPISLSALWLVIAWRLGLEAHGVGYPGHFLVRYQSSTGARFVDAFAGGTEVPADAFRASVAQQSAVDEQTLDYLLAAVTRRQILARMFANLKSIFLNGQDAARALTIQEFVVALTPWSFPDIRDRGMLKSRTGDIEGAIADLELYLDQSPGVEDSPVIEQLLSRLRR